MFLTILYTYLIIGAIIALVACTNHYKNENGNLAEWKTGMPYGVFAIITLLWVVIVPLAIYEFAKEKSL